VVVAGLPIPMGPAGCLGTLRASRSGAALFTMEISFAGQGHESAKAALKAAFGRVNVTASVLFVVLISKLSVVANVPNILTIGR
jgi:hypothetical protein